ncbi:MAG: deoxyribose-phosphate aldolase, partial [Oscillatoriales cyanobacterium SM2_1_8]|nr:deoxyribose-phosphate aldolase [Oscillatoriales cyanobacterium SM2_1_8]
MVALAVARLHRKSPKVATVIGFPSGSHTSETKRYEAAEAVEAGATELDVVINLAWLRDGNVQGVYQELATIVEATNQPVKAILEMPLLTPAEVAQAVAIALDAGVACLKTGTGWSGPVTVAQVQQLVALTKGRVPIKAAGGIRQ